MLKKWIYLQLPYSNYIKTLQRSGLSDSWWTLERKKRKRLWSPTSAPCTLRLQQVDKPKEQSVQKCKTTNLRLFSLHLLPLWYQVRAQQAVDHVNLELDNHDYSQHHMLGLLHPQECGQTQPWQPTPPHPQNWRLDNLHQRVDQVKQECVYNSTRRSAPSSPIANKNVVAT